jgi:hypothetical protein
LRAHAFWRSVHLHVIQGAASFVALDDHGAAFTLEKIVSEPTGVDLAILKFRAHDVAFLKLRDAYHGDIRFRKEVSERLADDVRQGAHARKVIESYQT